MFRLGKIEILNQYALPKNYRLDSRRDFYIGRGSALGNPYTHLTTASKAQFVVSTRGEAVAKYGDWLIERIRARDPAVIAELDKIANAVLDGMEVNLICFCSPKLCHGSVIRSTIQLAIQDMINTEPKGPCGAPVSHCCHQVEDGECSIPF